MDTNNDIINLPHWEPKNHKRMTMLERAAQFAPFSALTGYDAAIMESGRHTDDKMDLEEYPKEQLNRKISLLMEILDEKPTLTIIYFQPDAFKSGGSYQTYTGIIKKIDEYEHQLIMQDGKKIPLNSIMDIDFNPINPSRII